MQHDLCSRAPGGSVAHVLTSESVRDRAAVSAVVFEGRELKPDVWRRPSCPSQTVQLFLCVWTLTLAFCAGSCSSSTPEAASSRAGEAAGGSGDYAGVDAALPH